MKVMALWDGTLGVIPLFERKTIIETWRVASWGIHLYAAVKHSHDVKSLLLNSSKLCWI